MPAQIKVLRLITGEDIIGFVESYDDILRQVNELESDGTPINLTGLKEISEYSVFIRHPIIITSKYDPKKKQHQLFLTRWLPYTNDEIVIIPKDKVLTATFPAEEVEEYFLYTLQDLCLVGTKEAPVSQEEIQKKAAENILNALSDKEPVQ